MSGLWAVLHGALLLGMVLMSILVLRVRDLMVAAIALAAFSLMMALEYYLLQAPDVAIAEAGIGAAFSDVGLIVTTIGTLAAIGLMAFGLIHSL